MSRSEPHPDHAGGGPDLAGIELLTVLQALSDPVRLEIVRQLAGCVDEAGLMCRQIELPVTKSTSSHHLKVLSNAGITAEREQGVRNILSDAKEDLIQRIADLKQTFYICNLNNNPPQPLPYFYEMIAEWRQAGLKICVAGSSRNTHFILEKMGIFSCFDAVVDRYCYDIQKVKPEPDIYLAAFKKLNCEPNSCAIVTNSVRGIKAAKKTGAKTIGISTTVSKENLASFKPDLVVDNLNEIKSARIKV